MKRAPQHLQPATRRWWSSVVRDWKLEPHHIRILTAACESWDRAQEARAVLAAEGIVVQDRYGSPKAHPACGIERDSKTLFARLVRELRLDDLDPPEDERLPRPALGPQLHTQGG